MATVRQTVTTVQQSSGHGAAPLDNSLDALLEDLQSSVARGGVRGGGSGAGGAAPAVNGVSSYRREVTRTLERDAPPQVMHLAPANPTTVVAERSASPLLASLGTVAPGEQRSVSYKTYQYQTYHTAVGGESRSATLPAAPPARAALTSSSVSGAGSVGGLGAADSTSDARLQQNLHELDSLLVDLRHAQRAGFDPPPPAACTYANTPHGSTTTTRTEVVTSSGGIDPGLLEPLDHSTPAPPARQPMASTPTQQQLARAVEYKTYRTERQHYSSGDGGAGPVGYGAPAPPPPDSPRPQPKRTSSAQRELVYGSEHVSRQRTRSPSPGGPQHQHQHRREYTETRDRYREKSPSHQRLQREIFYNESNTTSSSGGGGGGTPRAHRYREPSPPPPQHQQQPLRRGPSPGPPPPPGADYPTGGTRTVTTVRTYNYSTGGSSGASPSPAGGQPPSRGRSPSPSPQRPPYRSPSPVSMQQRPALVDEYNPPRARSPSPGPRSPRLNQHTTVHTYTYDGHSGPPAGYHAPPPPTTVTTYKYSTSSSDRRYPEEQPLLQPRPFPTPSPTPPGTQPPKRLDDLMASFSDSEHEHPPNSYYRTTTERTVTSSRDGGPLHGAPAPAPTPATNGAAVGSGAAKAKEAGQLQVKDRTPTTNVAGPPVYYPPGVEMFAQREEASMQMSGGGKAKGKYKYEYESKEKSKSSQSQGAAVVPVCLPLCCAMPCVIM